MKINENKLSINDTKIKLSNLIVKFKIEINENLKS